MSRSRSQRYRRRERRSVCGIQGDVISSDIEKVLYKGEGCARGETSRISASRRLTRKRGVALLGRARAIRVERQFWKHEASSIDAERDKRSSS